MLRIQLSLVEGKRGENSCRSQSASHNSVRTTLADACGLQATNQSSEHARTGSKKGKISYSSSGLTAVFDFSPFFVSSRSTLVRLSDVAVLPEREDGQF